MVSMLCFLSATYQKIKPMLHTSGGRGLERGSNYCVTLVVGDKSSDSTSVSRSSEPPLLAMAGWQQDTYQDAALRSYASLPRPRNKSVFKKFFGKKDLWGFFFCFCFFEWQFSQIKGFTHSIYCAVHMFVEEQKMLLLTIFMIGRTTTILFLMCLIKITSQAKKSLQYECVLFQFFWFMWKEQYYVSVHCIAVDLTQRHVFPPVLILYLSFASFWIVVLLG